nr:TetR/AcrR family transcriptional regulator [Actinomycetota bacterium]
MEHDRTARDRILDAALAAAADHGIARLSVGDVAHRAGLSRQTLYKYFPSKQTLVSEAVAREAADVVRQVVSAAEQFDDPAEALFAGVFTTLSVARDHPLLDRLLRTEPESILGVLIAPDGPVVGL